MLNDLNSAKRVKEEIIPQSNQVVVHDNGTCEWYPIVVWSVTHCPTLGMWFPFDEQRCSFIYESWKYNADEVNLTSYFDVDAHKAIQEDDLQPNDLWELLGKSFVYVIKKNLKV